MKQAIFILLLILTVCLCQFANAQVIPTIECYNTQTTTTENSSQKATAFLGCNYNDYLDPNDKNISYEPNENSPTLTVRINIHVMQKSDGTGNFQNTAQDIAYLHDLINQVNYNYSHIEAPVYGGATNDPYIANAKIQFDLVNIYFHQDDVGWTNNGSFDYYNKYCYNTYRSSTKREIEIYLIQHTDSSKLTWLTGVGYGSGEDHGYELLTGIYYNYTSNPSGTPGAGQYGGTPFAAQHVCHETGHCLGLFHTFYQEGDVVQEKLSDTYSPDISGVQTFCSPCCVDGCSNNVMSYSGVRRFFSPMQIGKMRRLISEGWRSKLVDNCQSNCTNDQIISSNLNWEVPILVLNNIVINNNATLRALCKVYMPSNKSITVENSGTLNMDYGNLLNICNNEWNGIVVKSGGLLILSQTEINDYNIVVESGGTIMIKEPIFITGNHNITINSGGYICIDPFILSYSLKLINANSLIKLNEGATLGYNPSLPIQPEYVTDLSLISVGGSGSIIDYNKDVYIQAESITDDRYIGGKNIYVGNHVTTDKTQGDVTISNGANVIFDGKTTTFDKGFQSTQGSTYEVKNH